MPAHDLDAEACSVVKQCPSDLSLYWPAKANLEELFEKLLAIRCDHIKVTRYDGACGEEFYRSSPDEYRRLDTAFLQRCRSTSNQFDCFLKGFAVSG